MSKGKLYDYVFEILDEEVDLLSDVSTTEPDKWRNEDGSYMGAGNTQGGWVPRIVNEMMKTYKE